MSAIRPAVILVVFASSVASAEPPLTATVGLGVARSDIPADDWHSGSSYTNGPAFRLELAYRVHPRLAIGAHAGISRAHGIEFEHRSMFDVEYPYSYSAIELGVMAQVMLHDRIWLSPWIGMHTLRATEEGKPPPWIMPASLGYGVAIGGDVYQRGVHGVALYVSATRSVKHDSELDFRESFVSFTVGVAYHYR